MRDARFRRKILIQAQLMVQELDEIEDQLERFRDFDRPAFEVWQRQLFDADLKRLADLEQECRARTEKHLVVEPPAQQTRLAVLDQLAGDELKAIYRKFVRRLHPDRLNEGGEVEDGERRWQTRLWDLGQSAREEQNVKRLEQLYRVALVRLMDFSELSLTDAHEVYTNLRGELEITRRLRTESSNHPGWEFSLRSDLRILRARVERVLAEEISRLEEYVLQLRTHRAYFKMKQNSIRKKKRAPVTSAQLSLF